MERERERENREVKKREEKRREEERREDRIGVYIFIMVHTKTKSHEFMINIILSAQYSYKT